MGTNAFQEVTLCDDYALASEEVTGDVREPVHP